MTTAWAQLTHGRPWSALETHTTGSLLAMVVLVAGLTTLSVAARGRGLAWQPSEKWIAITAVVLASAILVEWLTRIWIA